MKAILLMDMPENCDKCPLGHIFGVSDAAECKVRKDIINPDSKVKPDRCPLKPMPERKIELVKQSFYKGEYIESIEASIPENKGWNACIDVIEGSKG